MISFEKYCFGEIISLFKIKSWFLKIKSKNHFTYHPPCRVNVKPKRESRSTDTRMPIIPSPCGVITCPRITDTRLHNGKCHRTKSNDGKKKKKKKKKKRLQKKLYVSDKKSW